MVVSRSNCGNLAVFLTDKSKRSTHEYTQLTQVQGYQVEALYKAGHNQTMIANILTVHKSTISRELRRNRGLRGYRPKQAHAKAMQRRQEKLKTHIPLTTWVVVNTLIEQDWSPEQISGRLYEEQGVSISHEWIYLHIYGGCSSQAPVLPEKTS
jgi:IS30 family transposase